VYRFFRNTHLFLGIGAFLFLLMYGLSAVQMAHDTWFSMAPAVTETRVNLPAETADDPRAIARELRRAGVRGEMREVHPTEAGYKFEVVRPGTYCKIEYTRSAREAKVRMETSGFMGMLNRIHHIAGTWHGYSLIDAWGVFIGLVSGALIVLGVTGIYLWFKTHGERAIGAVLLAVNLVFCITVLVLIRMA
jgi:hypothetical protein